MPPHHCADLFLLCDADGTLFPSEEPAFEAAAHVVRDFLGSYGVDASYTAGELRRSSRGRTFRGTALHLAAHHGIPVEPALAAAGGGLRTGPGGASTLTIDALEWWMAEENRIVADRLEIDLAPDPEVLDALIHCLEHAELAVVTSSPRSRLDRCLRATGLDELFPPHRRFSAEDSLPEPRSKPDPAIYRFALATLGTNEDRAIAIEDSVPGARSSVGAGIPTIANLRFTADDEREERAAELREVGAVGCITSWDELPDLIRDRRR